MRIKRIIILKFNSTNILLLIETPNLEPEYEPYVKVLEYRLNANTFELLYPELLVNLDETLRAVLMPPLLLDAEFPPLKPPDLEPLLPPDLPPLLLDSASFEKLW